MKMLDTGTNFLNPSQKKVKYPQIVSTTLLLFFLQNSGTRMQKKNEETDRLMKTISDYTGISDNFKLIAFSMIFINQMQNGHGLDV